MCEPKHKLVRWTKPGPFSQKYGKDYAPVMMEQSWIFYNSQGKFADSIAALSTDHRVGCKEKAIPENKTPVTGRLESSKNTPGSMTGSRANTETVKELQRLSAVHEQFSERKDVKKESRRMPR